MFSSEVEHTLLEVSAPAGKIRLDENTGEGEAWAALQKLQAAKRRKGYQATGRP